MSFSEPLLEGASAKSRRTFGGIRLKRQQRPRPGPPARSNRRRVSWETEGYDESNAGEVLRFTS